MRSERLEAKMVGTALPARVWIPVLLAALVPRLVFWLQARETLFFQVPVLDAATYVRLAGEIWSGSGAVAGRAYFRPPLYPLLLGLLERLGISGPDPVSMVQMGFGVATALLTAAAARRLRGDLAGLVAGVATATAPILLFFEGQRLITSLYTLLVTLLLYAALVSAGGSRVGRRRGFLLGVLLGLTALARPNGLIFLPLLLWLCWRCAGDGSGRVGGAAAGGVRRGRWQAVIAFLAGAALVLTPVWVRNGVVGGDWVLISSNGGVNFYIGNHPGSDGMSAVPPGHAWEPYVAEPSRAAGHLLTPSEVSRYWVVRTLRACAAEPWAALRLELRKVAAFFTRVEVPNNLEYGYVARSIPILRAPLPAVGWLTPPALAGVVLLLGEWRRGRREAGVAPLFLLLHLLAVVPFFVCARYRTPALPLLALLTAVALVDLPRVWRRGWRRGLPPALAFGVGLLLGPGDLARAPEHLEAGRNHYWDAVAEMARAAALTADPEAARAARSAARRHLDAALLEAPGNADALLLRARLQPTPRAALADLDRALESAPGFVLAHVARAERRRAQGRPEAALADYRAALASEPFHPQALAGAATLALRLEQVADAAAWAERLTQNYPRMAQGWFLRGRCREAAGAIRAACADYRRALQLEPENPMLQQSLAEACE